MKNEKAKSSDYKELFQENIERLKGEIHNTQEELDFEVSDYFPTNNDDSLDLKIEIHDYEKDIEEIKEESKETLECLANLYLSEEIMANKNINNIIGNDSSALSDLKFSISCSKRGLINLMKQIDNGSVDAELYQAVALFQREMKEGINMLYKLQKSMKEFFKDLKDELKEINVGDNIDTEIQDKYSGLRIADKDINKSIDKIMKNNKK